MTSTSARRTGLLSAAGILLSAAVFTACDGGATAAATASGGSGGQGASGGDGGSAGSFITGGSDGGPTIDEDSACATSAVEGKTLPVTMLIMFDKSASMLEDQKWAGAKAALISFFQNDETAGLSIGLRFFPDDQPASGCNDQVCSIEACSQPLVPPAPLTSAPASSDPQQKALVDAVNAKTPSGQTPMYAALGGAEKWAKENAVPGEASTVVVLVTEGEPTTCNTDIGAIASLAEDARVAAGVFTYTIGMFGSNAAQLDQIAAAGGTEKALLADAGSVSIKLVEALTSIKKAQIACTYDLPAASMPGEVVDPGKVNVNYKNGSGQVITLPRVDGAAACPNTYAWYYDDPAMPTAIQLCPGTCAELQNDPSALVKILLGCETVVK
jgi:von Willebrand factor type A domain